MDPTELMELITAQMAKIPALSQAVGENISAATMLGKVQSAQSAVQDIQAEAREMKKELDAAAAKRRQKPQAAKPSDGPRAGATLPPEDPEVLAATAVVNHVRRRRLVQVVSRSANDIAATYTLSNDASALLMPSMRTRHFLFVLAKAQLYADAIEFLAHALPKMNAVWWGSLCWQLSQDSPAPEAREAVNAAVRWVVSADEKSCLATYGPAEKAGLGTAAGLIACGAFWAGSTMTLPPLPPVPPKASLTHQAVAAGIKQLTAGGDAASARKKQRQFIVLGIDVASDLIPWR